MNGSFASPIASADYAALSPAEGGLLSRVYNGMSGLSVTVTLLLILVAYDQCEFTLHPQLLWVAEVCRSQICLEQGINCWTVVENTLHWAVPAIRQSKDGRI